MRLTRMPVTRALLAGAATLLNASAFAADGFEFIGFGPRQKALGGAGAADSRDAMSLSLNPAGVAGMGREVQIGAAAIIPERGYKTSGFPVVVAPGDVRSQVGIFPLGNAAYVEPIDANSSWGVTAYAHGGIHAAYGAENIRAPLGGPLGGGFGRFDNRQIMLSVAYARKFGPLSIGVAPTLGVQMLNVEGGTLMALLSRDPGRVSNKGDDWAVGGGVRVGLQYEFSPTLRVAAYGSTPIFMTPFSSYSGLLAGSFDLPAHVGAGVAYDVTPDVTVMADWKHIFYGAVDALAKPTFPIFPGSPGSTLGFGARDTDAEAIGLEWRTTRDLTLRLGYRHSSLPFGSRDVTLNIYSPGVTEHHATGGLNYRVTPNSSIDVSVVHGFKNGVTGPETTPFTLIAGQAVMPQINPAATVTNWLRFTEVSLGYNYRFDAAEKGVIASRF